MPLSRLFLIIFGLAGLAPASTCLAANPHVVGWVNTFVPGAGQYLLGKPVLGASQFALEGASFGYGYALSPRYPMTIDGVPEALEVESTSSVVSSLSSRVCVRWTTVHGKRTCVQTGTTSVNSTANVPSTTVTDNRKAGYADLLQEFGLKYHMVNVFNAYREAASPDLGQGIDQRDTSQLFLDPFHWQNLSDPWVYVPLLLLTAYTIRDYGQTVHTGVSPLQPMNGISNRLLAFNYEVWQPFGSGAPEEMFYRGFLQNELFQLVRSPWFSIPMSTAAFAFSHAEGGRPTAAAAGAYLGFLAHKNKGNLGPGITLHFWTVVLLGIETIALTDVAQGYLPLRYVTFDIPF